MTLNIELLKKLVRLANNNPNENEANLAARKACKLIEESKFAFGSNPILDKMNSVRTHPKPPEPRREPQRPTPSYTYYDEVSDFDFNGFMKDFYKGRETKRETKEEFYKNMWSNDPFVNSNEKRNIICSQCKERKETRFRGPADIWVCMDCRGKESFK